MTIYERLDDATRKALGAKEPVHRADKRKEKLSRREWENIMGKHRDTYKRVNGKVKRK